MNPRAALLLIVCAAWTGLTPAARAEDQRIFARLSVNGVEHGDVLVVLRDADILCQPKDLEAAGLRDLQGRSETLDGASWKSLASLAPDVTYEFDPKSVAVFLTAKPQHLLTTRVDFERSFRPPGMVYSAVPSAFLNYAVQTADGQRPTGSAELGASVNGALLHSVASVLADGSLLRGFTSLTLDDPSRLRRIVAGDQLASTGQLGSTLVLGGLSIAREFSLDPYFVAAPRQQLSGVTTTPSRLEVYSDGRLVRQDPLPAGPFELSNLPGFGTGDQTRIVVRDAFGRTQEFSASTRVAANVLAPGLSDYAYQIGFRRTDLSTSFNYGAPALLARHRLGLTDWLTGGLQLEADQGLVAGGPVITGTSRVGALELAMNGSTTAGQSGAAASAAYNFTSKWVGGTVQAIWMSPRYATLTLAPERDRPHLQLRISASTSLLGLTSVSAGVTGATMRDGALARQAFLNTSTRIAGPLMLLLSGSVQRAGGVQTWEVFGGLSLALGNLNQANAGYRTDGTHSATSLQAQRGLPPAGTGFGYNIYGEQSAQPHGTADVTYQGTYGRYEAIYSRNDSAQSWSATASGALVAIGGGFFATRPVEDGFALIQVPGVEGVRGYLNNFEVGRTNASGNLLVPNVIAYYGNRLGITDRDIPWNYSIGATERTVAAPSRGGALVRFKVNRLQAFTGSLRVRALRGTEVPANAELTLWVGGVPSAFPIGLEGQFYVENLAPGRYPAEVLYGGGTCRLTMEIPPSNGTVVDLGLLFCDPPAQLASATPASSRGSGVVRARVFLDVNGDGAFSADEPVFPGIHLLLDTRHAETDAEGSVLFTAVPAGKTAIRLASAAELPSGYRLLDVAPTVNVPAGGQDVEVALAVRRAPALKDSGRFLTLPVADGNIRVSPLQAARFPLQPWVEGAELSRAQDAELQRLGSEVLDSPNLRVLVVVQVPAGPLRKAYASALTAGRAALRYLQGPALVPRSRLIWTLVESPAAGAGFVEILLVRLEQPRVEGPASNEECCVASVER